MTLKAKRRLPAAATVSSETERLTDRAFHLQLDQSFELDAIFHRELTHQIVHESVYAKAHRLCLGQAALLHVKDLFGAHLAHTGFVLDRIAGATNRDRRV